MNKDQEMNYTPTHKFYIAGVQHHKLRTILNEVNEGDYLQLVPEPTNQFDSNAVRIEKEMLDENVMTGYVPRKFSSEVSALLQTADSVDCVITKLNKQAKPWEMAEVEIRRR